MISLKNKLLLKRFVARQLRKLVDLVDERLHAWEVSLRTSLPAVIRSAAKRGPEVEAKTPPLPARVSFLEWEARKSGVSVSARPRRRRAHQTSADFDRELREHFSRSAS
jgi:hypothetical protein